MRRPLLLVFVLMAALSLEAPAAQAEAPAASAGLPVRAPIVDTFSAGGVLAPEGGIFAAHAGRNLAAGAAGDPIWLPAAIFNDGVDSTFFSVEITGGDFDAVYVTTDGVLIADETLLPGVDLLETELIRLYDDGSNGDLAANDDVYSRGGIRANGPLLHDGGSHRRLDASLFFFEASPGGSVSAQTRSLETGVGVVNAALRGAVLVTTLGPRVTATSHAVFVEDDGTIFPNYPNVDASAATRVCLTCELLIDEFGDVFDFIVIQTREVVNEPLRGVRQAFYAGVANDVLGTGDDLFDLNVGPNVFAGGEPFNTFSQGRLQGIIFDNRIDGSPLSHEVMHRWGAFVGSSLGWLDGAGHFLANTTVNGLMDLELLDSNGLLLTLDGSNNPTDLVRNGDGTFRLVSRIGEFNPQFDPVELYLAGFLPASQVPEMYLLQNPDFSDPEAVTSPSVTTVTIDDIVALEGPRQPTSISAPRDFNVGVAVVSDRPYSEADYTFITLAMRYWESNKPYDGYGAPPWRTATQGQSRVTVELPNLQFVGPPANVTLNAGSAQASLGGSVTVSVTITDAGGNPVQGATIEFSSSNTAIGTVSPASATTDSNGRASTTFNGAALGDATVTASVGEVSENLMITVVEAPPTRNVPLSGGWNLVGWTGSNSAALDAVAGLSGAFNQFFTWDAEAQRFLRFQSGAPAIINTLQSVPVGAGVWINLPAGASWEQPTLQGARGVALRPGFNLVMWTGPDGMPVADAVAGMGTSLDQLFIWDPTAQAFLRYGPTLPAFLNTAATLQYGDGVWINVKQATTWDQPAGA